MQYQYDTYVLTCQLDQALSPIVLSYGSPKTICTEYPNLAKSTSWHDISTSTQLAKTEGLLNDHSATILLSLEDHGAARENEYKRPAGDKLAGKRFCH